MQNKNISRALFIVILLILLINVIVSTANLIEDGALSRSVIPPVSWGIATLIWIGVYLRKNKGEN